MSLYVYTEKIFPLRFSRVPEANDSDFLEKLEEVFLRYDIRSRTHNCMYIVITLARIERAISNNIGM